MRLGATVMLHWVSLNCLISTLPYSLARPARSPSVVQRNRHLSETVEEFQRLLSLNFFSQQKRRRPDDDATLYDTEGPTPAHLLFNPNMDDSDSGQPDNTDGQTLFRDATVDRTTAEHKLRHRRPNTFDRPARRGGYAGRKAPKPKTSPNPSRSLPAFNDILDYRVKSHQEECPKRYGKNGMACPSRHSRGYTVCIVDRDLCDGVAQCPEGEDEDPTSCLFYKMFHRYFKIIMDSLTELNDIVATKHSDEL